jgi:hypothetical protein
MSRKNVLVAIYDIHSEAEAAIEELKASGYDMKNLSIAGKGHFTKEAIGYYTTGERIEHWGKRGTFWGLLVGAAFFIMPGLGHVMVAGALVSWIVGSLESAVFIGGLSVLGAALYSIGVPKKSVLKYEEAIRNGKFLLVVHGVANEVTTAKEIILNTSVSDMAVHQE